MPDYSQDDHRIRVDGPLGKDVLLLRHFAGTDGVSTPFSYTIDLYATKAVKPADLLEKPLTLTIELLSGEGERVIHGLVTSLISLGRDVASELYIYRADIAPWLWFLSLTRDCRIFQEVTALEIVEKVFSDRNFSDYRIDCRGELPKREFSVQYRESDLDFVSRLLEEEGIFYFFEHTKDKHTLVLADHPGALESCPGQSEVHVWEAYVPGTDEGVIDDFYQRTSVHTGKAALNDYSFENPGGDLLATVNGQGVGEIYDYPGGYVKARDGTRYTELRLEAEEAGREALHAFGNCASLTPGYRFRLKEAGDHDGEYLLLEVNHEGGSYQYVASDEEEPERGNEYRNELRAIPKETPYRPPRRTARPLIQGAQTAVVVGPSGDEIYTDKYGRVKVRFHWDREGPNPGDEKSSCWIRVATTWAGNKWGAIQIPRIGQEVIVEFLEGNPDRPLITGSVYNAKMMPPFGAKPTQSGLLTRSSADGSAETANELRFEDKKDSEEIFLHAEKNFNIGVENDQTVTVGNDQTVTVEHDQITAVANDQTTTVDHDQTTTVKNDQKLTVDGKQTIEVAKDQIIKIAQGDRSVTLNGGSLKTKASAGKITYEAMQGLELKVGSNTIKIDMSGVTIKGMMVKVEGTAMAEIKSPMTQVKGDAMLQAKGGITMIG
ncbi:MAG: type VI secretion system Vgr family protein [Longimicrobiales bacterium]